MRKLEFKVFIKILISVFIFEITYMKFTCINFEYIVNEILLKKTKIWNKYTKIFHRNVDIKFMDFKRNVVLHKCWWFS